MKPAIPSSGTENAGMMSLLKEGPGREERSEGGQGTLEGMLSFASVTDSFRMPFLDGLLTPPWTSSTAGDSAS